MGVAKAQMIDIVFEHPGPVGTCTGPDRLQNGRDRAIEWLGQQSERRVEHPPSRRGHTAAVTADEFPGRCRIERQFQCSRTGTAALSDATAIINASIAWHDSHSRIAARSVT